MDFVWGGHSCILNRYPILEFHTDAHVVRAHAHTRRGKDSNVKKMSCKNPRTLTAYSCSHNMCYVVARK